MGAPTAAGTAAAESHPTPPVSTPGMSEAPGTDENGLQGPQPVPDGSTPHVRVSSPPSPHPGALPAPVQGFGSTMPSVPSLTPQAGDGIEGLVRDAVLHALHAVGPQAYFERLARTEPKLFAKYVVALLGNKAAAAAQGAGRTVVNVISAIPRSPLDALPDGFHVN